MKQQWMAVIICIGLTACAASGPAVPPPNQNSEKTENATEEPTEIVTQNESQASPASEVVVVDIPQEPVNVYGVTEEPVRKELVCKRERQTGSNRSRKVCRSREQIAKDELDGKKTFEDLHRSQREYD